MIIPTLVAVVVFETQDSTLWNLVAVRMAILNRWKSYILEENIKRKKKDVLSKSV